MKLFISLVSTMLSFLVWHSLQPSSIFFSSRSSVKKFISFMHCTCSHWAGDGCTSILKPFIFFFGNTQFFSHLVSISFGFLHSFSRSISSAYYSRPALTTQNGINSLPSLIGCPCLC